MGAKALRGADVNEAGGPSMQHIHRVWNDDPRANPMMVLDKWAKGLGVTSTEILERADKISKQAA